LAEVKALAVNKTSQKKQLGSKLVAACIEEAKALGIPIVFCLTYKPDFFESRGLFASTDQITRKVWSECFDCPKFPDCDEVALYFQVKEGAELG